jgi:hypothetical protein
MVRLSKDPIAVAVVAIGCICDSSIRHRESYRLDNLRTARRIVAPQCSQFRSTLNLLLLEQAIKDPIAVARNKLAKPKCPSNMPPRLVALSKEPIAVGGFSMSNFSSDIGTDYMMTYLSPSNRRGSGKNPLPQCAFNMSMINVSAIHTVSRS